jgi:putative redox protein
MYRVEITSTNTSAFKVKSKGYEFFVDTKGKGITPPDTLLASLGSCIGVYLHKYLEGYKIPMGDFSITVESDLSKTPPFLFKDISVSIDLKGLQIDEQKRERLMEFIKNCPVHNTLETNPQIKMTLIS